MLVGHILDGVEIDAPYEAIFMRMYQIETAPNVAPGKKFSIVIVMIENEFLIAVNQKTVYGYNYLEETGSKSEVFILGGVEAITQFDFRTIFPIAIPATQFQTDNTVFSTEYPHLLYPGFVILLDAVAKGPQDGMFIVYFPSSYRLRTLLWFGVDFATRTIGRKTMNEDMEYVDAVYDGPFPIELNKRFRLAFGFTNTHFMLAVNGKSLDPYPYPFQPEEEGKHNNKMFNCLMGLKIVTKKNLELKVRNLYHHKLDEECEGLGTISHIVYDLSLATVSI
ncbi:unnamed protein product [Hermetia illucens]|uniref:Galectin n=2 Tax=Hermetia illucens TaxID=343691 RepID=A0A7R8YVM7_HERIL|nr:unnamed protein product [Hermetia illucens]